MKRKNKILVGIGISATAFSLMALGIHVAKKRGVGKVLNEWKDERIRDAFYNTITEKDVAWG